MKKRGSDNSSAKSEIRNMHSFNYGQNFRRTRESFLDVESSDRSQIILPNAINKSYSKGKHALTQEEIKAINKNSYLSSNASGYNSGKSSALNFDTNILYNPHRLKKSPYEIVNYEEGAAGLFAPKKYSVSAKKYKKRKNY